MVNLITYFKIRLLKFIVYSLYGYLPRWSKTNYSEGRYGVYESYSDSDLYNYFYELSNEEYKKVLDEAKWLL